ncbi:MAG: hypothetical protein A4E52_00108 [Pelotomaculum sp. PtaB.Bin013]|nr:MAG: hypothetical protein A4E52_00108 [Pelotomaculum sp. PtaB.Bin013]
MKRIFIPFLLIILIAITGCSEESADGIKMPFSSGVCKGDNYQDVISDLKNAGFTNVETEVLYDLVTGILTKDGEVEKVSVNGDAKYDPDARYPKDVKIVVTYHTFPKDKTSGDSEEPKQTQQTEKSKETGMIVSNDKAKLEAVFHVENAKRAAVVALTNAYATDVFAEDKNHYDISKFHSYADVSGDFLKINSEGTWNAKNDNTWNVANLKLETIYKTIITATLDVSFDGTNYIVSNITGTLGNPGASSENMVDISEIEAGKDKPYLTVSSELIKDDRDKDEVEARDHSDDLDKNTAIAAFEQYGKKLYPYGFKCHWIVGLINEEQSYDGSWFFKVDVTIKNQYGTERKAIAEGKVSGTDKNPKVDQFYVSD